MSVRVGWSMRRPREAKPDQVGRHVALFEYLKIKEGRGKQTVVGYLRYGARDLIALREKGVRMDVRVIGILRFAEDVTPDLARAVFGTVRVSGWVSAPPEVKSFRASA